MNDYEYLAFEPKMTWKDLCEWVENNPKYGFRFEEVNACISRHDGAITDFYENGEVYVDGAYLSKNVTPERMKIIIENLFEAKE